MNFLNNNNLLKNQQQNSQEAATPPSNSLQTPLKQNNRFDRIPQNTIQSLKQNMFASYLAIQQNIGNKRLWRKEIVQEINEFVQMQMGSYLQEKLLQKELEEYNLILKLTKKKQDGSLNWYLIKLKPEKKQDFLNQIDQGKITIQNLDAYGKILYKGLGDQIPKHIQKNLEKEYYMQMRNKAIEINSKAYLLTREKKYNQSIELYTQSLRYDRLNSTAYNNRAYCYIMIKDLVQAEKDLVRCLKIDNKFENAYKHLATIYLEKQEYEKSLSYVNQALEINTNYPEAQQLKLTIVRQINVNGKRKFSDNELKYEKNSQESIIKKLKQQ